MSYYELYIERRGPSDGYAGPILPDEWLQAIKADPRIALDDHTGLAFCATDGGHGVFKYHDGRISFLNPSNGQIVAAVELARALGANVYGRDGECYDEAEGAAFVDRGSGWELMSRSSAGDVWLGTARWREPSEPSQPGKSSSPSQPVKSSSTADEVMGNVGRIFFGVAVVLLVGFVVAMAKTGAKQAQDERVHQEQMQRQWADIGEHVRRGEAGTAFQRLFAEDNKIYEQRAKAGDPNVRPLDKDPYEYMFEQAKKRQAAEEAGAKPEGEADRGAQPAR